LPAHRSARHAFEPKFIAFFAMLCFVLLIHHVGKCDKQYHPKDASNAKADAGKNVKEIDDDFHTCYPPICMLK
jgi:hypothetical protein